MACSAPAASCAEAASLACQIKTRFGMKVTSKGERAIQALLLMRNNPGLMQKEALQQCGTSKFSMQTYDKLLRQLQHQGTLSSPSTTAPLTTTVATAAPTRWW